MTTTYKVEISHLGTTQTIEVREDQTILQAAYKRDIVSVRGSFNRPSTP